MAFAVWHKPKVVGKARNRAIKGHHQYLRFGHFQIKRYRFPYQRKRRVKQSLRSPIKKFQFQ